MNKKSRDFPQRIELIHLPFYIFDVFVNREGEKKKITLSVDGLLGNTVFFIRENINFKDKTSLFSCDFELSPSDAGRIILNEYKGLLLEHGLRTRRYPKAEEISPGIKIFYPFWVGYFKKRKGYDFKALDAVSGEIQGVKMRKVFMRAFRQIS
ncbi:MAG: hypothetical protein ACETWK_06800 [Candidatus Aminicenantaceae bacterium]